MKQKIIITIPAFNEEATIAQTLDEIHDVMKKTNYSKKNYSYTLQVVDDGSQDKTAELARKHNAVVIQHKRNLGLARTFQTEIKSCIAKKPAIIIHTDADGQYNPQHIPEMIEKIQQGYDLVLGSRFKDTISYRNQKSKLLGNIIFAKVLSKLIRQKITDATTGYRAFTLEVAKEISFINTFTYTQEQIIKAARQGFKITEIPIEARATRESRLFRNPLQYAMKSIINILRIYRDYDPLKFFGSIGAFFSAIGILIGIYFVYLHFTTGISGHLGLLMLMLILIFTGLQIAVFGLLADMNRN